VNSQIVAEPSGLPASGIIRILCQIAAEGKELRRLTDEKPHCQEFECAHGRSRCLDRTNDRTYTGSVEKYRVLVLPLDRVHKLNICRDKEKFGRMTNTRGLKLRSLCAIEEGWVPLNPRYP
jgi:hypothetical protein